MKKIYICAVLGMMFASCSSEEETTNNVVGKEYSVNEVVPTDWMDVMEEIQLTCVDVASYKDVNGLIDEVESIALSNSSFKTLYSVNYDSPVEGEVSYVMQTEEEDVIDKMNYSTTAKQYLKELIVEKKTWSVQPDQNKNLSKSEIHLLNGLLDKHDPDDDWNKNKPLAVAYGYQSSIGKAIVMGVIVSEFEKVNKIK
ncbi:hypothetical protein [Myroides fluvii]|uniref:hypothetical protein n=1 Tax=Myroides fluvii TaxID=2572594 RepID=UPI00131BE5C4|nr:hypothetical protein [Myroides fluvii]